MSELKPVDTLEYDVVDITNGCRREHPEGTELYALADFENKLGENLSRLVELEKENAELKARLAKWEIQEPVAYKDLTYGNLHNINYSIKDYIPLFTRPKETDEKQSAAERFCDKYCTWAEHHPLCYLPKKTGNDCQQKTNY
jgi:hypothetical protein